MSGLLLAVGPPEAGRPGQAGKGPLGRLLGRTIELHLTGFIVVFSATGLVPFMDLIFPIYVTIYLWILSIYVFPSYNKDGGRMEVFHGSHNFQVLVILGAVIGFFLPLAYVLGGFVRGDHNAVRECSPHLFLLSAQVLSEVLVSELGIWSPPVRVYLAAIYNARRIFSLLYWVSAQNRVGHLYPEQMFKDHGWIWFGRFVCVANLIYYISTMYFFIIPIYIPRAFERYNEAKAAAARARTSGTSNGSSVTPASTSDGSKAAAGMKLEKKSK